MFTFHPTEDVPARFHISKTYVGGGIDFGPPSETSRESVTQHSAFKHFPHFMCVLKREEMLQTFLKMNEI